MSDNQTTPGSFPWQHIPSPGKLYGSATVGERGQIAIPAEARKALEINTGDKLVVFGNRVTGALVMISADVFEDFADFFMTKLNKLGEHAEAFFAQFTEPPTDDAGNGPDLAAAETAAVAEAAEAAAGAEGAKAPAKPRRAAAKTAKSPAKPGSTGKAK
ncbi:MAG: AbrB/MazE/SpoVT family DNA-binding domain-containing protein [Bifidobacteriaceae bacterium]|jgi:AbrB family looped-hinge helix DNA binding protein|nr:AbrB/MazE/SpoVT family DNA-binding domain-containing protein [Bifidobacteriaceae bacterium]